MRHLNKEQYQAVKKAFKATILNDALDSKTAIIGAFQKAFEVDHSVALAAMNTGRHMTGMVVSLERRLEDFKAYSFYREARFIRSSLRNW